MLRQVQQHWLIYMIIMCLSDTGVIVAVVDWVCVLLEPKLEGTGVWKERGVKTSLSDISTWIQITHVYTNH